MAIDVAWTAIADGQVDADSPINQLLMQSIKDNLYHLELWLGKDYTAANNHDHDDSNSKAVVKVGTNAVNQAAIAANAVGQSELKTSSSSTSGTSGNRTMTGGLYCLYPQVKTGIYETGDFLLADNLSSTSYATRIAYAGSGQGYSQHYYVSASGEFHWIFLLYEKGSGKIIATSQAPDHVCFGNRGFEHPFGSYDPSKHEIVVINPDLDDVQRIMARMIPKEGGGYLTRAESLAGIVEDYFAPKRDWFDVFNEMFEIQESKEADWIPEPVSIALPEMLHGIPVDWRFVPQRVLDPKTGELIPVKVDPIQRVIPKPDYITPLQIIEK